ncbi:hypothetical protein [Intestinibacter sp.]|uniref:hypothetical protein n=1 Tax=Intestinibacter sp. TaxID=1965304 RepID=UPI002A74EDCA|nr:hypothetical protein [Intestinibacter sp.]MDY2738183.1 hypothetical protein [Intestinibacter sp.]MDY4575348.1 hypothetical protein [Intestinibacter sp.]
MKLDENIYDVLSRDKDFTDAAIDVTVDRAVMDGGDYIGREAFTVTITELLESILMGGAAIGFIRKKSGNNLIKTIIN